MLRQMVEECMAPGCVLLIGPSEELPRGYERLGLAPLPGGCPGAYCLGRRAAVMGGSPSPPPW
eukprot:SAG11_NODE_3818_length_2210_cov_2.614874_2_plen_63_part_00